MEGRGGVVVGWLVARLWVSIFCYKAICVSARCFLAVNSFLVFDGPNWNCTLGKIVLLEAFSEAVGSRELWQKKACV